MRDYDPTTGRYIQADPLGLVDGASVYGYALQNPGRFVDSTGPFVNPQKLLPLSQTDGLICAAWEDDCQEQWIEDQQNCFSEFSKYKISDRAACLQRAHDIYLQCLDGKPENDPWSDADEDVPNDKNPENNWWEKLPLPLIGPARPPSGGPMRVDLDFLNPIPMSFP